MALDDQSNGKIKFGAKSEFVRSLDRGIPAAEVVALAERRGMKLTAGFVYNIRSSSNGKINVNGNGSLRKRRTVTKIESAEQVLRAAIAQIGLAKAREILDEVEETFAGH
ncbi:MAG: hypothetical protein K0R38_383 [Polyangiaceae bacterium]|jgi:hypothetical protein|nr:hypothetical protein [Polyangiaceae bacterium]